MVKYLIKEANKFVSIEYRKILKNIGWLFFDRVFRMGMGLVVGAWLARYLGPSDFGTFNYLLATIGIFMPFASLGLESMIVKELVEHPQRISTIMSTSITLRLLAGMLSFSLCVGIFFFLKHDDMRTFYVGMILALTLFAQALVSMELYYQSQVASKVAVISQSIAYVLVNIIKVILILVKAELMAFAVVTTLEMALGGLFMIGAFKKITKQRLTLMVDWILAKKLLSKGWPLIFSGFMIMIYMRIDQIMLGEMINDYQVGTYSAALKLSEIWYIIPTIICNSFFPSIIEAKKLGEETYFRKIQNLFNILFILSFVIAIVVTIFSDLIIHILYGTQYKDAATILSIHIWTSVFVFVGVGSSSFFIVENLQLKTFTRTALGAVVNIGLNVILIPKYLAVGAAVATLISQFLSSYAFDLLSPKTYVLFRMKSRAFLAINYISQLLKKRQ
ncbi:flippase [Chryseolinea sp. H1M3-3]|uniref:flippase n=1 Tax=Chryseolinea sp. H1M3-3 TaxID=3034144 RepID=UPI0023EC582A|nr:flippase [Chryseolinea sp. H1M3-3]